MHSFGLGVLLILLSAFGFGLMPIFAAYAYAGGVNVPTLLFLRFSLAAICFFSYLSWRGAALRLRRRELLPLLFLGSFLYTLQSTFYFSAVRYIPASLAALILYLYPVFVAGMAVWLEKEPLTLQLVLPAVLSLAGIAVVLGAPLAEMNGMGVSLAFGAAVVYSVYIILGRRVVSTVSPLVTSAYISTFAALSFLLFGLVDHSLQFAFSAETWTVFDDSDDGGFFCRHGTNRRYPGLNPQYGRAGDYDRLLGVATGRAVVLDAGCRCLVGSARGRLGGLAASATGLTQKTTHAHKVDE